MFLLTSHILLFPFNSTKTTQNHCGKIIDFAHNFLFRKIRKVDVVEYQILRREVSLWQKAAIFRYSIRECVKESYIGQIDISNNQKLKIRKGGWLGGGHVLKSPTPNNVFI